MKSAKTTKKPSVAPDQLHAGEYPPARGKIFHTDTKGLWWCGYSLHNLTPKELLDLARSVEADLLRHYPELR